MDIIFIFYFIILIVFFNFNSTDRFIFTQYKRYYKRKMNKRK